MKRLTLVWFLVLCSSLAHAYEFDTHFLLTYMTARSVGFTPEQSLRIASADQQVDICPETEPVQGLPTAVLYGLIKIKSEALARVAEIAGLVSAHDIEVRTDFHAFAPTPGGTGAVDAQLQQLLQSGNSLGNIGIYLHAFQDSFSHAGYSPVLGHWDPTATLPFGHYTDYLSFSGGSPSGRDAQMAVQSGQALATFMTAFPDTFQSPRLGWSENVARAISAIVNANPAPSIVNHPDFNVARNSAGAWLVDMGAEPVLVGLNPYAYGLVKSGNIAVPAKSWAPKFSVWSQASTGIRFTKNRANISPGEATVRIYIYDRWQDTPNVPKPGFRPYRALSVPDQATSPSWHCPVGTVYCSYQAMGINTHRQVAVDGLAVDLSLPVWFDKFSIVQSNKAVESGPYSISGLRLMSDVRNTFPVGHIQARVGTQDKTGRKRTLTFGGIASHTDGCHLEHLGWKGFRATHCHVEVATGAFYDGSIDVSVGTNGSGVLSFHVSGKDSKGEVETFSGSGLRLPANTFKAVTSPSYETDLSTPN